MRRAVIYAWKDFNKDLEGIVPFFYLDKIGKVTIGMGQLCDDSTGKMPVWVGHLPLVRPDGKLASYVEIEADWNRVHAKQEWRERGGVVFGSLTTVRLPTPAMDALIRRKLLANDAALASIFRRWYAWPADATIAVHSMCWAMGSGGFAGFPKFRAAADRDDWAGMIAECDINPKRGTIVTRNARNKECFRNAARVQAEGLDPEVLLWRPTTT